MKTHVEFKSDNFPAYKDEEEEINPGRWGRRLAEFLHAEVGGQDIKTEDIYPEDWGWVIPIYHDQYNMFIGVGNYEEYDNGFLVFIEPSKPFVRKGLFKKIDTRADVEAVFHALNTVISQSPDIYDIRWWDEGER